MRRSIVLVLMLAGCGSNATSDVGVELSAVTLADDCGDAGRPQKPPTLARAEAKKVDQAMAMESQTEAASKCAGPNCGFHRNCDATSMQLAIRGGATKTTIKIKKVELLDTNGKVLEVLTARKPSQWTEDGKYVAWDEAVTPNQRVAASYLLSVPRWDKVAGGRWKAHEKKFKLRVTVTIGDTEQTIERESITPVMMEPEVMT